MIAFEIYTKSRNKKRAFAPYKYEIAMLREGAFREDLKEKILEVNK